MKDLVSNFNASSVLVIIAGMNLVPFVRRVISESVIKLGFTSKRCTLLCLGTGAAGNVHGDLHFLFITFL